MIPAGSRGARGTMTSRTLCVGAAVLATVAMVGGCGSGSTANPTTTSQTKAADRVPSASDTQPTSGVATVNRYGSPLQDVELALARAVYAAASRHDLAAL